MPASVLALMCFTAFGVALRRFFARPDGVRPGMQLIQLLGVPLSVVHVAAVFLIPSGLPLARAIGIGLYAASLLLFLWAWRTASAQVRLPLAFSTSVPSGIVESGPYRLMRHPFYTAYLLAWLAGAVYCTNAWLLLSAFVFLVIYSVAIAKEEGLLLAGPSGLEYAAYRTRVGLAGPSTRPGFFVSRAAGVLTCGAIAIAGTLVVSALRSWSKRMRSTSSSAIAWGSAWNHAICRFCLLVANVAVRRDGVLEPDRPALIVSNHLSWLDAIALGAQGRFVFVAAREFDSNLLGFILRSFGTILIDRTRPHGVQEFCWRVREALCAGRSVVAFPEATTTDGTFVRLFHSSVFEAALEGGAATVPVGLSYGSSDSRFDVSKDIAWTADSLVQHGFRFLMRRSPVRATLAVGAPIEPWLRTRNELAAEARARCAALAGVPCNTPVPERPVVLPSRQPLPEWFVRLVTKLHEAGILPAPADPAWHVATRIADTGLDSLAVLVLEEEVALLGRRCAPWRHGLTLGEWLSPAERTTAVTRTPAQLSIRRYVNGSLTRVGQLRYRVYVEELKRPFPSADLARQVIVDALDQSGVVLACEDGRSLAATCRLNWAPDAQAWRAFEEPLQLAELASRHGRDHVAIASKLVVDAPYRRNPSVISLLLAAVVREAQERGATVLAAHTRGTLTSVMARAGFQPYGRPYFDREWGSWQHPIAADVETIVRIIESRHTRADQPDGESFIPVPPSATM